MPQIQVLPRVPSPLEELMPYISQAIGSVAGGLQERSANRNDEKIIRNMFDPELTPMQRLELSLKLSPKRRDAFFSGIRAQTEGEKFGFQKEREKRLSHADVLGGYDKRISQLNADLKEARPNERKPLKELKENLVKEQAVNRARLRGGKEPIFKYLEMQDTQPEAAPPEAAQQPMAQAQPSPEITGRRVKWDPSNRQHIARRDMILKQAGGDRAKANQLLAQEFDK